jgi:hypothetical protein
VTIIEMGKVCSTHTAIVIYISLLGNYQAKRPSENLEKDGKIMFQNYNVRMTTGLTFLKM